MELSRVLTSGLCGESRKHKKKVTGIISLEYLVADGIATNYCWKERSTEELKAKDFSRKPEKSY